MNIHKNARLTPKGRDDRWSEGPPALTGPGRKGGTPLQLGDRNSGPAPDRRALCPHRGTVSKDFYPGLTPPV